MSRTTAEPFWDLVAESLDEAAFLWKRWEGDLASPVRSLEDVRSWTEERLQGALDGVRVAGDGLVRLTGEGLESDDPARLAVCAHLLAAQFAARGDGVIEARTRLAEVIREATGERLWHIIRGVEVAELDASFAPVTAVLSAGKPEHLAALCRLRAFRRSLPSRAPHTFSIDAAFGSGDPTLQIEVLRVLRHVRDDSAAKSISVGLESDNAAVRGAAIACGVRQRHANAWDRVRKLTYERNPEVGSLLSLLAAVGTPEDAQLVVAALREPALQHAGLFALGYIGTPEAVGICLKAMADPRLARVAAEVYCTITGADLQRDRLIAPEPEEGASPPALAADPLDANLVPVAHDLWPLPDANGIHAHWQGIKEHYVSGVRHLYGRPVDLAVLVAGIESGPMLRRPDLITELTIRSGGRYDVEPRAFARVQRRMMIAGRGALH
jgi:uncharacterized protein (TIGR02270 family)